jgi:hypothetical protein
MGSPVLSEFGRAAGGQAMHLRAKRPIFVPVQYFDAMDKLSKSTLMDMVWDLAKQCAPPTDEGGEAPDSDVIGIVMSTAEIISDYRKRGHK